MTIELTPAERAALDAAQRDPSRRLGPLIVLRELGRGGMGQVLLAFDPRRGGLVAVKTLLDRATGSARARLEREAKLLGSLDHPGIAALYEAVFDGPGAPYLVMEMVRGRPLDVDEDEPMEPRRAAALVAEIAHAVGAAHAKGVVHRDLKPQNVMLREDGRPVVLDFGLARREEGSTVDLTRTGTVVGTLAYLAPEQIGDAKHADARADVYALGGILYTCLTGHVPFDGPAAVVLARVRVAAPPRPSEHVPGLDPALEALVLRCLEKKPDDRPATAEEVAHALEAWLAGTLRTRSRSRAPRLLAAAGGVAALTLVAAVAISMTSDTPPQSTTTATATATATVTPPRVETATPPPVPVVTPGPSTEDVALADKLVERALHMTRTEDQAAAEALCTRALELAPDVAHTYGQRGLHRYNQGDHLGAVEDYTRAAELEPEKAIHQLNLGVNLAALGERDDARRAFDRALELRPGDASTLYARSDLSIAGGDLDGARADLEACLAAEPRNTKALASLGWLHCKRKEHAEAVLAYERAIAIDASQPVLHVNLARNLVLAGRGADALRECERSILQFNDNADVWKERGFVRYQMGDVTLAITDLERALVLAPGDTAARAQLTTLREELAASSPASAPEVLSDAMRLVERAKAMRKDTPQLEAEALCTQAIALAPDLATAWAHRGFRRFMREDYANAAADYREATRLEPRSAGHLDNLSVNLMRSGDAAGALVALDRAVTLDPSRGARTLMFRIDLLITLERFAEAIAQLEGLLARLPDDLPALEKLGYAHYKAGQHPQAVDVFTRLIRLQPEEAAHLVNRAYNLLGLDGRFDDARKDAERSVELGPTMPEAWHARGVMRLRAEDLEGAEKDFARALELAPGDESAAKKLKEVRARLGR